MDIESIALKARKSIENVCIDDCKAYCCRKGYITLKEDELKLVTQGKDEYLLHEKILEKKSDGKYTLSFEALDFCPSLKNTLCLIHKNPKRPKVCRDYPLFIAKNSIYISPSCLAFKQGKFFAYIKKFRALGMVVEEKDPFSDIESFTLE
ncbi:MAG: YkgJ family cysteine cluster protein [Nanoarchaeota archaeon]|nr:YkgJ family cysteine cluster protein [Nanoarchaeota archaeon]